MIKKLIVLILCLSALFVAACSQPAAPKTGTVTVEYYFDGEIDATKTVTSEETVGEYSVSAPDFDNYNFNNNMYTINTINY